MGNEADVLAAVVNSIKSFQEENRLAFNRIHDRIDQLLNHEYVERLQCEQYRMDCQKCMDKKIEKAVGWPPWITGIAAIASAVITSMAIFIITGSK